MCVCVMMNGLGLVTIMMSEWIVVKVVSKSLSSGTCHDQSTIVIVWHTRVVCDCLSGWVGG